MERLLTALAFVEAAALVVLLAVWFASAEEPDPGGRLGVPADTSAPPGSRAHNAVVRDSDAVSAAGGVPAIATSPFTPPKEEVVTWPSDGPLGVVLCGRITTSLDGSRGPGPRGPGRAAPACILTDAQGRRVAQVRDEGEGYVIPGLAPGRYAAKFWAPHHRDDQRDLEITGAPNPLRCDVRLERNAVVRIGALTPEGTALAPSLDYRLRDRIKVAVSAAQFSGDRLPPEFEWRSSRKLGSFLWRRQVEEFVPDLQDRHIGVIELRGDLPLWLTLVVDRVILGAQLVAPGAEEVTFVVAASALERSGEVRFRVVEAETGKPLERFGLGIGNAWYQVESLPRLDDGSVVVRSLAEGPHRGWIGGQGREMKELAFEVGAGETSNLGIIKLRAGRALSGRLEDAEGHPRPGPVRAISLEAPGSSEMHWTRGSAASDGTFSLKSLAPERYRVVAWSEGLAASWAIADTSGSDVAGVVIRLATTGTKVTLRAKIARGRVLEAILSDGQGPLWRGSIGPRRGAVLWLAPGGYTVDAALPGAHSRRHPVVVGVDEMMAEIKP